MAPDIQAQLSSGYNDIIIELTYELNNKLGAVNIYYQFPTSIGHASSQQMLLTTKGSLSTSSIIRLEMVVCRVVLSRTTMWHFLFKL